MKFYGKKWLFTIQSYKTKLKPKQIWKKFPGPYAIAITVEPAVTEPQASLRKVQSKPDKPLLGSQVRYDKPVACHG